MPQFSSQSQKELSTCHPDLVKLLNDAIQTSPLDFTIVQGARSVEQARQNFANGTSKLNPDKGEFSKHIVGPEVGREKSLAVDLCPYIGGKLDWNNERAFFFLAGWIHRVAKDLGVKIRYGGGWDLYKGSGHLNTKDQLQDPGHFELL